ncbi:hypothetical protein K466DRAFT_584664 [Polyporus arcularius HHB13444]|uniref:Uncharacterized protein n=1 Tax=Polyporus arcularius HHB13444 TaxID=1314778 RepID=A0A5C3PIF6_9APHY|nr:hypothetical protein K466DRAFT_584664 [Polyporus arcularius HHB13444]
MSMATARTSDDAEVTYRRPTSYDSARSTFSIATPSAGRLRFICLDLPSIPFSEDAEFGPPEEMIPCEIPFVDRKGDMITVSAALARTLHRMGCYALAEGNFCPFPQDVDRTLSLVFHFPDYGLLVREIATVEEGRPISLNWLAFRVAQEMKTCMDLARAAGRPMRYNGLDIQVDKLVMKRLKRVSRDSWQPEFCIWC